jgi:hypothetical protein
VIDVGLSNYLAVKTVCYQQMKPGGKSIVKIFLSVSMVRKEGIKSMVRDMIELKRIPCIGEYLFLASQNLCCKVTSVIHTPEDEMVDAEVCAQEISATWQGRGQFQLLYSD